MKKEVKTKEEVFEAVEKQDVRFVRLWFTDILGQLKSFAITPRTLEGAFDEGMGFDGSSIKGFARIDESDIRTEKESGAVEREGLHLLYRSGA